MGASPSPEVEREVRAPVRGLAALAVCLLGLLASAALAAPAARADADPGDLDESFGGEGIVTTAFTSFGGAFATDIAIQGNLIAAAGGDGGGRFALGIYTRSGSVLNRTTTNLGGDDRANGVAFTPGSPQKIVSAGTMNPSSGDPRFALTRHNLLGVIDRDFGGDGEVTTAVRDRSNAEAVAVQPDGKVVAAGDSRDGVLFPDTDFALARYRSDGTLDPTFDGDGIVITGFGEEDLAHAVAIQPNGKIVVAGHTWAEDRPGILFQRFALARLHPNGSLDFTFDDDGKVSTDLFGGNDRANAVAIQRDGKIVVAGSAFVSGRRFAVARYNPNGSLDRTFSGDGKLSTTFAGGDAEANAVAIQADGKIVVAGRTASGGGDVALARYNANGTLDGSFGNSGRVRTGITGGDESAHGIAIQPDGKIVIAGQTSTSDGRFLLARYHAEPFDDTPPETTIESAPPDPTNDPEPTFEFGSSEEGSRFACSIDDGAFIPCSPSQTFGPFEDGDHSLEVRATDRAGNTDPTPAIRNFTVDTVAPETTIDAGPSGTISDPVPTFGFSSSESGSSFECDLDGGGFAPCSSPHTVGPLADGAHSVSVRATDEAGNTDATPASRSFTVEVSGPPSPPPDASEQVDTGVEGPILKARKKQRLGKRIRVKLRGGAAEAVRGTAKGKIVKPAKRKRNRKRFRLKRVKKSSAADELKRYKLKPKRRKHRRKVRRLLRRGRTLKAKVRLKLRDQAGHRIVLKRTVRLKAKRKRR